MKQQSLLILTSLLLSAGLLGGCTPIVSTQTLQATAENSQAAAEPIYTITPQTNTPPPTLTATATSYLTATPPITNSVTSTPTDTETPTATITPVITTLPLTSDTLTPVSAAQTPWLDWAEQYLSVDTVCAPHSADLSLAAFRGDGFHVYDPRTNDLKWTYEMPVEPVGGGPIVFSPDSQFVAHGGSDKMLHVWDAETGELVHEVTYKHELFDVKFSGDGQWVVVLGGEFGAILEAMNVFTGRQVPFPIHAPRSDTAMLPDSPDILVLLFDLVEDGEQRILKWQFDNNTVETFVPLSSDTWFYEFGDGERAYYGGTLDISPDGNLVSLVINEYPESFLHLWNVSELKWIPIQDNEAQNNEFIGDFAFTADGSFFALDSLFLDGIKRVRVWHSAGALVAEIVEANSDGVAVPCPYPDDITSARRGSALSSFAFTPDGAYLATFGYLPDGTKDVLLWPLPR